MSTHCFIGITSKTEPYNKIIKSIYCHWDGDTNTVMPKLLEYYNTKENPKDNQPQMFKTKKEWLEQRLLDTYLTVLHLER